ncbi:MAG: divalent metal cation transporter [Bacteroidota bacterium]
MQKSSHLNSIKVITAIACLFALIVPVFGANPIEMQILSQVFNVFVLPLVILGILLLVNNKNLMKGFRTSVLINIGLITALFFSLVISFNGIVALSTYF